MKKRLVTRRQATSHTLEQLPQRAPRWPDRVCEVLGNSRAWAHEVPGIVIVTSPLGTLMHVDVKGHGHRLCLSNGKSAPRRTVHKAGPVLAAEYLITWNRLGRLRRLLTRSDAAVSRTIELAETMLPEKGDLLVSMCAATRARKEASKAMQEIRRMRSEK